MQRGVSGSVRSLRQLWWCPQLSLCLFSADLMELLFFISSFNDHIVQMSISILTVCGVL